MWGISCYCFLCLLLKVFKEVTCSHLCPEKMPSFPLVWVRAENMKLSGGLITMASSMEFSRREYWGRLPFPTPGDLLDARTEPASLGPSASADRFFTTAPGERGNPTFFGLFSKYLLSVKEYSRPGNLQWTKDLHEAYILVGSNCYSLSCVQDSLWPYGL